MLDTGLLLLLIGLLGAFDVFYFHRRQARIAERPDARREAWIHVARGVVYTAQFLVLPNVKLAGLWYAALVALFVIDAAIAIADVLVEPDTRASVGGLPRGEYLAHVVLSVLVGALLYSVVMHTHAWAAAPTRIAWEPSMPVWLRLVLGVLAMGCFVTTLDDLARILTQQAPAPVHVLVRLHAPLEAVWRVTQDHHVHPTWDHRFSKIVMLAPTIATGTEMRYEKRICGMVIRGFGRYKLHRPLRQSTFEFWSDDWRSPIRRGVGLWRYVPRTDGSVDFRTSYSYEVRWGVVGRVLDRLVFRRWFQRETERSFARLRRDWFGDAGSEVVGAHAGKPVRLAA